MNPETEALVDRAALEGRLEPFLLRRLDPGTARFRLRGFRPALTPNRLDLATKVALLESLAGPEASFPARLYDAHVAAFSLGDMTEPGDPSKRGPAAFRAAFMELRDRLARGGFDPARSLIPLASDGTILNGAHRVACALHLGLPLVGVETGLEPVRYDGAYFHDRGMAEDDLDAMALAHVLRAPDAALAFLWPAAPARTAEAEAILAPVIHRRAVRLTPRGAHNLMSQVYAGEPWLGPAAEDFPGILGKLAPCFSSDRPLRVLVLDLPPGVDRAGLKDRVRRLWSLGKHSIHMTDTRAEAIRLARLLLSPQGRHFLDHARPNRFPEVAARVAQFRAEIRRHGGDPEATALDTGMVLGAYGLRAPGDVDFRSADPLDLPEPFERHAGPGQTPPLGDVLTDPALHFHYWDQRFVALPVVAQAKMRRMADRDPEDLALIAPLLTGQERRGWADRMVRLRLARARLRRGAIGLLARLGLRDGARRLYRRIRPRG